MLLSSIRTLQPGLCACDKPLASPPPLPHQVLGQLIDLIDCGEIFYRPVEVTAKERLFFTVVDSYDTSSRIMDALAARRAGGGHCWLCPFV